MGTHAEGYSASADSIDNSSHILVELAGLLYQGRPDGQISVEARVPRSHREVSDILDKFARFSNDQFLDTVSLLVALSSKLTSAGNAYTETDRETRQAFGALLTEGVFVRPEDR
ncbi:hypothetical protein ACWGJ2_19725 [Streptomyces sp. NPDC054796]